MERYFILMIVLAVSYYLFRYRTEGMQNCSKSTIYHFLHATAASKYPELVAAFGEPNILVDQPHGAAIWKGSSDIFESIMLLDEAVGHMEPFSHCDCVYATIRVHIPDNLLPLVLGISKSIYYDRLKKHLTVRCHSIHADVATLWLAMTLLNHSSDADVIAKEYESALRAASDKSANYYKMNTELSTMVHNNQTMYANELEKKECVFMHASGMSSSNK